MLELSSPSAKEKKMKKMWGQTFYIWKQLILNRTVPITIFTLLLLGTSESVVSTSEVESLLSSSFIFVIILSLAEVFSFSFILFFFNFATCCKASETICLKLTMFCKNS